MKLYKENWKKDSINIFSVQHQKELQLDFYFPNEIPYGKTVEILLFNDGQILEEMNFKSLLESNFKYPFRKNKLFLVAAVHADEERVQDYGTIGVLNAKGQGKNAKNHGKFITEELLPYIAAHYPFVDIEYSNIAGFSLGGLSAFDIAWTYPTIFKKVGVFSGSFWWRSKELNAGYDNEKDRIMLSKLRKYVYQPNFQFFFECGTLDEDSDRNNNGIIDSIDDTKDIIVQLKEMGYSDKALAYLEITDGKHDVPTWKKAMPIFLKWGWDK